jgi:hypothetical protein
VATIPLPYGFSIFHNAGRLAMEAILRNSKFVDEKRTAGDLAMDFMGALANNFAPFGGTSTPLQYFAPTIVKPVVQQLENKTWYGAPIHPEPQQFGKAKSNSEQYFRSTSDTAKELSRFLNNVSGGDESKAARSTFTRATSSTCSARLLAARVASGSACSTSPST